MNVQGKTFTIVGAARSGISAANLLLKLGAHVKISDAKALTDIEPHLSGLVDRVAVRVESGGHTRAFIEHSDAIIVSPGIPHDALPYQWAKAKGLEVMGEIELAYHFCPCPIIAVTGSNGKTTTVTLISEILKAAGRKVCLRGNIGQAFSQDVLDLTKEDLVVLEISSFQLQNTIDFRPHIAVWTNFSQNHLDRHRDLQEYFEAKTRIFINQKGQDVAILNAQQPEHVDLARTLKAQVDFFNTDQDPKDMDNPNHLAAMHAVQAAGVKPEVAREVFQTFKGVEHRLEFVRTVRGVDFINDSKSTTVEAGRWALERAQQPVVLMCGGLDKHLDYRPLRDLVKQKVKHLVAIGQARTIMKQTFGDLVGVSEWTDFGLAVEAAFKAASPGDCVLLSPMCASFDMFQDYEHRGRVFKETVQSL